MLSEDRIRLDRAEDEQERKTIEAVRKFGVQILSVFDDEGKLPDFSYTVGLWHTHGHPEILISGLKQGLRHRLLSNLNKMIAAGRSFRGGESSSDVVEGYRCYFQKLPDKHYREYLGWDIWFYGSSDFEAVQMLWPSVHHLYPWDKQADEFLKNAQEVLTKIQVRVS